MQLLEEVERKPRGRRLQEVGDREGEGERGVVSGLNCMVVSLASVLCHACPL